MHNSGYLFIISPIILLLFSIVFVLCICCLVKCCSDQNQNSNQNIVGSNRIRIRNSYQQLLTRNSAEVISPHSNIEQNQEELNRSSGRRNPSRQPLVHNSASPVVVPPYPVEPRHPTPHTSGAPPPVGFAANQPPYPTHTPMGMPGPYPPTTAPYPPTIPTYPVGSQIGSTPYPPTADPSLPPSYQEAVAQAAPSQPLPPSRDGYTKQAPYNPHY